MPDGAGVPLQLPAVAEPALLAAAVLPFVARPVAVWLCTLKQGYRWRERTVLAIGGLKGAVPIVPVSVLIQAIALLPTVRWLGFEEPQPAWAPVAEAMPLDGIEIDLVEPHVAHEMVIDGRRRAELAIPEGPIVTAAVRRDEVTVTSPLVPGAHGPVATASSASCHAVRTPDHLAISASRSRRSIGAWFS